MLPSHASLPLDLRHACLHEYAHLAVARHFGACGFVTIRRVVADEEPRERYCGTFRMHGELADDEWRIVALAGAVAEHLAANPGATVASIVRWIARHEAALSGADALLARGYESRHVERCVEIVRAAWGDIECEAREREAVESAAGNIPG